MRQPRIEILPPKKLIGMCARMSYQTDATAAVWRQFMPRRSEIQNRTNTDYYSMQIYDAPFSFADFTPATEFEKWAAVEVSEFNDVPTGMRTFDLPGDRYAVFLHRGPAHAFPETLRYIHAEWFPSSGEKLAHRPHFEILQENYDPQDPDAEETVWVPLV